MLRFVDIFFRMILAVLCLASLKLAWADTFYYRAKLETQRGRLEAAELLFQQAIKVDPDNPRLYKDWGTLAYKLAQTHPDYLTDAEKAFDLLTKQVPVDAKGWIYHSLTLLEKQEQSRAEIAEEDWQQIREGFKLALALEPGNAWIQYTVGKNLLIDEARLSAEEKQNAVQLIHDSLRVHYSNAEYPHLEKISPLLRPALEFLWNRYHDFALIEKITPANRQSYKELIAFIRDRTLWEFYPQVDKVYLDYQREDYTFHCLRGEELLRGGGGQGLKEAFWAFRKAFWMRSWSYPWAKAGVLITQYHQGQMPAARHELFQEEVEAALQKILEDEDDSIGTLMPSLKGVVKRTNNFYLAGLQALRSENYEEAKEKLLQVQNPSMKHRRYLAAAYFAAGNETEAKALLKPALEEPDPDLRELLFLKERGVTQASQKIEKVAASNKPASAWWGDDKSTMTLNLMPGPRKIRIFVRSKPDAQGKWGLIRISLEGKPIRSYYASHLNWLPVEIDLETTGGKRWLQVEFLQGTSELGPVKIE